MKRNWPKRMIIAFSLLLLSGCNHADKAKNTLKVGISAEYPPFEFRRAGELQGFDIDLAKQLGKKLNKTVEFVDMDFFALIPALHHGKVDMVIAEMNVTEQRKQRVDFSSNYYDANFAIISLKTTPYTSLEGLSNKPVGAQLGSTMETLAKTIPGVQLSALPGNPTLIEQLKLGRLSAVIMEDVQAKAYVAKNPSLALHTIGQSTNGVTREGYAIAFAKHSPLLPKVEHALQALKQQNVMSELKTHWMGG